MGPRYFPVMRVACDALNRLYGCADALLLASSRKASYGRCIHELLVGYGSLGPDTLSGIVRRLCSSASLVFVEDA